MANICSVDFNLNFKTLEDKEKFVKDMTFKIAEADFRKEGIEIAKGSKWLFDPMLFDRKSEKNAALVGWVKWSIDHEDIREFTDSYLNKMGVESFECYYEETGNMIYGKYHYEKGELIDYFVSDSHPVWKTSDESDNYFNRLDTALENDGVMQIVA